jgi:hypothetical protein
MNMRHLVKLLSMLLLITMALTGCGGSDTSTGAANDPLSNASTTGTGTGTGTGGGTIFGNISTTAGKTGITLKTDLSRVDVNNGQILVTAKVVKDGAGVSGIPVTFSIAAPANR